MSIFDQPGYEGSFCITRTEPAMKAIFYLLRESYTYAEFQLLRQFNMATSRTVVNFEACRDEIERQGLESTCAGPFSVCPDNDNIVIVNCGGESVIGYNGMCDIPRNPPSPPAPMPEEGEVDLASLYLALGVGGLVVLGIIVICIYQCCCRDRLERSRQRAAERGNSPDIQAY